MPAPRRSADLVGPSHAKDIFFSARFLDADEAYRMGLVNRIVPEDELETEVRAYAELIARNAPLTIKAAKAAVNGATNNLPEQDLDEITRMVDVCFDSDDYVEGRRAFLEKRTPKFTGS